jgi:hypothetical protein
MKKIVLSGTPIKEQNGLLPVIRRLEKRQRRSQRVELYPSLERAKQRFRNGRSEIAVGVFGYVCDDDVSAQVNQRIQSVVR